MNKLKYLLTGLGLLYMGCSDEKTPDIPIGTEPVQLSVTVDSPLVNPGKDENSYQIDFRASGGTVTFDVESSIRTWSLTRQNSDWLTIDEQYGNFTVTAPANGGDSPRTATLTITSGTGEDAVKVTIDIAQRRFGSGVMELSRYEINLDVSASQPETVEVITEEEWELETNSIWLLAETQGNTITLTGSANPTTVRRETVIRVVTGTGNNRYAEELIVSQDPVAALATSKQGSSFYTDGGSDEIEVVSNFGSWTVDEDKYDWIDITVDGNTLSYSVSPNGGDMRIAEYEINSGEGDNVSSANLVITQAGNEAGHLIFEVEIPANYGAAYIPIYDNMDCTVYWGDGTLDVINGSGLASPTHTYAVPGTYYPIVVGSASRLMSDNTSTNGRGAHITAVKRWGKTGLTSMEKAFYFCTNLRSIPGDNEGSFENVTTFEQAFRGCSSLAVIPEDLLAHGGEATTMLRIFCESGLEGIPDGLLDNAGSVTDLTYAFATTKIREIPAELFRYYPDITTFSNIFAGCSLLEEIPGDLFKYNTEVTTFYMAFANCSALRRIPGELFSANTKVKEFRTCFSACTSLTAIPAGLFDNNRDVENFNSVFQTCSSLRDIPEGLFAYATKATTVERAFYNCKAITSIPDNLFNCPSTLTGANIFYGCELIEEVPEGLFDSFVNATTFASTFNGCTKLKTVPVSLFDNCTKVVNFNQTFRNCSAWDGESPYTDVGGVKVKLWMRSAAYGFSAVTNSTNCFNGCTSLSDIDDVIAGWK